MIRSPKWRGCTYKDPTDLGENPSTYETSPIGYNNFPVSTHIHGLEVRPLFDGNPLSWFSKKAKGIGYMSLEEKYFDVVTDAEREIIYEYYNTSSQFVKMNHYPNYQPPGSLWYHDHSMSSTGFNVLKGLSGMYLLRDKKVEKYLPKGNYEAVVLLHLSGEQKHILSDVTFKTDAYYRFRFLNSHFLKNFPDISFVDPEENEIPFTLIGQDSSFMRYPVELVSFSIASAERIDLLIKFDSSTLKKGD